MRKAISIVILVAFISTSVKSPAYAQMAQDPMPFMPTPGTMVSLSPEYTPAYLKGIVIHPENALKFDFIIYKGDKELTDAQKREEYTKLTKYFLASLAIPDDDQWVNLSPYEKDRIIKDDFGKTEMGRDLLAQDYLLKQITASLIYPEDNLGKKFWDRVYKQAQQQYGTTNIPVNTFNKVWILPDDALIYEKGNGSTSSPLTAYVLKNHLRVMLEEDYLSLAKHSGISSGVIARSPQGDEAISKRTANDTHTISSKIIKEIILPELQREVNEDQNFAPLRQVYSGMLLATWFKRTLKQSLLGQIYANKNKIKGLEYTSVLNGGQPGDMALAVSPSRLPSNSGLNVKAPQGNHLNDVEAIYQRYLQAYKKGVFNFIKEDTDRLTNETIPRKYFSGGTIDYAMAREALNGQDPVQITHTLNATDAGVMSGQIRDEDLAQVGLSEDRAMNNPTYDAIATRAYQIYIETGRENADENWRDAEQQLIKEEEQRMASGWSDETSVSQMGFSGPTVNRLLALQLRTLGNLRRPGVFQRLEGHTVISARVLGEIIKVLRKNGYQLGGDPFRLSINVYGVELKKLRETFTKFGNSIVLIERWNSPNIYKGVVTVGQWHPGLRPRRNANDPIQWFIKTYGDAAMMGEQIKEKDVAMAAIPRVIFQKMNKKPDKSKLDFTGKIWKIEMTWNPNFKEEGLRTSLPGISPITRHADRKSHVSPFWAGYIKSGTLSTNTNRWKIILLDGKPIQINLGQIDKIEVTEEKPLEAGEPSKGDEAMQARDAAMIRVLQPNQDLSGYDLHQNPEQDFAHIPAFIDLLKVLKDNGFVYKVRSNEFQIIVTLNKMFPRWNPWSELYRQIDWLSDLTEVEIHDGRHVVFGIEPQNKASLKLRDIILRLRSNRDNAMYSQGFKRGGIDLNSANLNLVIKRDGHGVPLPLAQQDLAQLSNIEGLDPVILSIKPAASLPIFAELSK